MEQDFEEIEEPVQAAPVWQQPVVEKVEEKKAEPTEPGDLSSQFTALRETVSEAVQPAVRSAQKYGRRIRRAVGSDDNVSYSVDQRMPRQMRSNSSLEAAGSFAAIVGTLCLVWWLFPKFWSMLMNASGGGKKKEGGKWVSDRSMGGREVFVPDDPARASSAPRQQPKQRELKLPERSFTLSGTHVVSVAGSRRRAAASMNTEPDWWMEPRAPMYVHPNQKEQGTQVAKQLLKQLQDAKINGQAYPIDAIVELREACQAAGITVKPNTEAGRDSIFRAGVTEAMKSSLENTDGGRLAGLKPQQFVAGFAKDLGIPLGRAVQIVHAEVASRVRGMIIDACAAKRSDNTTAEMEHLLRLAALLGQFPLPRGSAEGEVISASIVGKSGLPERQSIFLTFGSMEPLNAPLMAELLGFDPELVLPQLEEYTRGH